MIFWITVIFGLMFGMMGYFTFDLLLVRLEESAIGVASGVLVACLVLVRHERDVTQEAATAFLRALRELVRSAAAVLIEGKPARGLASRILITGQRFRELTTAAAFGQSRFGMARRERLRRRVMVLGACENWGRELGTICLRSCRIEDAGLAKIAAHAFARIDATLACLTCAPSSTSTCGRKAPIPPTKSFRRGPTTPTLKPYDCSCAWKRRWIGSQARHDARSPDR